MDTFFCLLDLNFCKLMERSGSGFKKIQEVYKAYGKKFQPKVKSYQDYFSITWMDLNIITREGS